MASAIVVGGGFRGSDGIHGARRWSHGQIRRRCKPSQAAMGTTAFVRIPVDQGSTKRRMRAVLAVRESNSTGTGHLRRPCLAQPTRSRLQARVPQQNCGRALRKGLRAGKRRPPPPATSRLPSPPVHPQPQLPPPAVAFAAATHNSIKPHHNHAFFHQINACILLICVLALF